MNTKMSKYLKYMAAAIFIATLAINVVVTLDDPFVMLSDTAIATTTSTTSSTSTDAAANTWRIVYAGGQIIGYRNESTNEVLEDAPTESGITYTEIRLGGSIEVNGLGETRNDNLYTYDGSTYTNN